MENQPKTFKERLMEWENNLLETHPKRFNRWIKHKRKISNMLPIIFGLAIMASIGILYIGEIYFYRLIGITDHQSGILTIATALFIFLFIVILKEQILRPYVGSWISKMRRKEHIKDERNTGKMLLITLILIYVAFVLFKIFILEIQVFNYFLPLWVNILIFFGAIGVLILIWWLLCKIFLR